MINLLKTDYKRFFKDKAILIGLILVVAFSFFSVILSLLITNLSDTSEFSMQFSGLTLMVNSMSITNNMGLIIPIILGLVVVKDFTAGTIRNKVIVGCRKWKIYLSTLIVAITYGLVGMLLYNLLHLAFGSIFFGFGSNVTAKVIGDAFLGVFFGLIIYTTIISIAVFFGFLTKSTGLSITFTIVAILGIALWGELDMINNLPQWFTTFVSLSPQKLELYAMKADFSVVNVLKIIICPIVYNGFLGWLGIYLFTKLDVK